MVEDQVGALSQLLSQQDFILDQLIEGHNIDSVYLDYEKAYDKVDIGYLLMKVKNLGIGGGLGAWIAKICLRKMSGCKSW